MVRSDNLGAATHDLKDGRGRDFNERYKAILDHFVRLRRFRNEEVQELETVGTTTSGIAPVLVIAFAPTD